MTGFVSYKNNILLSAQNNNSKYAKIFIIIHSRILETTRVAFGINCMYYLLNDTEIVYFC